MQKGKNILSWLQFIKCILRSITELIITFLHKLIRHTKQQAVDDRAYHVCISILTILNLIGNKIFYLVYLIDDAFFLFFVRALEFNMTRKIENKT